jgi:hypothetical protein
VVAVLVSDADFRHSGNRHFEISSMGSLKKRRKAKISKHKRRKRMKENRHKKRLRYKS